MKLNERFANICLTTVAAAALLLLAPGHLTAQSSAKEPGTAATVTTSPQTQTPTVDKSDKNATQIYGLQGVLIETIDGKIVASQAADQGFNPASSIKLATALV
ncbi:MAG TPA: hypothetical protein VGN90_17800, partial [Pyrinomonadaceae bacterium]|nr:hypothetical protein [Pyrinomonadaceae bacterium]